MIASGKSFKVYTTPVVMTDRPTAGVHRGYHHKPTLRGSYMGRGYPMRGSYIGAPEVLTPVKKREGPVKSLRKSAYTSMFKEDTLRRSAYSRAPRSKRSYMKLGKTDFNAHEFDVDEAVDRIIDKSVR